MWERRIKQLAHEISLLADECKVTHVYELREYSANEPGRYTTHGFYSTVPALTHAATKLVRAKSEEGIIPKGWKFSDPFNDAYFGQTRNFLGTFFSYNRHEVINEENL